jgi:hypothetical protein
MLAYLFVFVPYTSRSLTILPPSHLARVKIGIKILNECTYYVVFPFCSQY